MPSTGTRADERRATGRAPSVAPKPVVTIVIETAVKSASTTSDTTASGCRRDRGEQEHADARAAAHAVHEADPEGAERRPHVVPMLVVGRASACSEVAVRQRTSSRTARKTIRAATAVSAPCWTTLGQVGLEEEDRHAEDDERERVAERPTRRRAARPGGAARSRPEATSVVTAAMWSGSVA